MKFIKDNWLVIVLVVLLVGEIKGQEAKNLSREFDLLYYAYHVDSSYKIDICAERGHIPYEEQQWTKSEFIYRFEDLRDKTILIMGTRAKFWYRCMRCKRIVVDDPFYQLDTTVIWRRDEILKK